MASACGAETLADGGEVKVRIKFDTPDDVTLNLDELQLKRFEEYRKAYRAADSADGIEGNWDDVDEAWDAFVYSVSFLLPEIEEYVSDAEEVIR